jgi:hypothetical protein
MQKMRRTRGHGMNNQESRAMSTLAFKNAIDDFLNNVHGVQYGEVSLTVKLHCGRVADVTHTVTHRSKG